MRAEGVPGRQAAGEQSWRCCSWPLPRATRSTRPTGRFGAFGCAVSQAGALPMDMQDSTAELLAMGPDVLKVLLHTPLPRLIAARGPSRLFCAA